MAWTFVHRSYLGAVSLRTPFPGRSPNYFRGVTLRRVWWNFHKQRGVVLAEIFNWDAFVVFIPDCLTDVTTHLRAALQARAAEICHLLHAIAAIQSLGTSPAHSWRNFTNNMLILQISSYLPCFISACIYLLHEVSPCLEKMWQLWSYCTKSDLPLLHKELGHLATCSGLQKALPGALDRRGRNCSNLKQNQEVLPLDKSKLLDQMW